MQDEQAVHHPKLCFSHLKSGGTCCQAGKLLWVPSYPFHFGEGTAGKSLCAEVKQTQKSRDLVETQHRVGEEFLHAPWLSPGWDTWISEAKDLPIILASSQEMKAWKEQENRVRRVLRFRRQKRTWLKVSYSCLFYFIWFKFDTELGIRWKHNPRLHS